MAARIDYSDDFNRFWDTYPKRANNPKKPAYDSWEKLRKRDLLPEIEDLIRATIRYAFYVSKGESKFIAHTATWLNQMRWEEWLEEERKAPAEEIDHTQEFMSPVWAVLKERSKQYRHLTFVLQGNCIIAQGVANWEVDRIMDQLGPIVERAIGLPLLIGARAQTQVA